VKTKLLVLVSLSIAASVAAVALLIEQRTHLAFRQIEKERTASLVQQFQREFNHEGDEITRGVETIANSESMQRTVIELSLGATDYAAHVNEAAAYATAQRLDFLDLVAPDGTIISSYHWPARFGYKETWFLEPSKTLPAQAFLKHLETSQGTQLALVCVRPVRTHGANFYLIGGRKLDLVLQALSPPEGVHVSIYSAPEQGQGELLGTSADSIPSANLMPLIQKAIDQHEASAPIEWGPELPQEQIVHAIALPGYADHVPAVLLVSNSLEQETTVEKNIGKVSLMIAGIGILLGIVVSGLVAARISRPIKKLSNAATRIGQGDWDVRVPPGSRDEIGKLASAFNQMTEELISQRERLVQSERVAAWRELARRLAHELKNPLFPLQITVENLLRARENTPEQFDEVFRESTSTLLAEISNLKTIIGRFSDFSKMPAPQIQAVDLDEMIRNVVQLFQAQLSRGPVKIEPELRLGDLPPVSGDPVLLRRVIENLVLNAIDAMPNGGTLTFRTELNHQFGVFELSDTGKGLTQEECDRLFTPYYTTKQHGTGLGLAIVQSVVSDHKGSISVSSTKNFGTTFHVELPLWSASAGTERANGIAPSN
jgi:signal transduction histidine kinase